MVTQHFDRRTLTTAALLALLLAVGVAALLAGRRQATTSTSAGISPASATAIAIAASAPLPDCADPSVIAAEPGVPRLPGRGAPIAVPAGEPAVVARVNGVPIQATQLESLVTAGVHRQSGQSAQALRQHILQELIDDQLAVQAAAKLGLTATPTDAKAAAAAALVPYATSTKGSQVYTVMASYLCAYGLTPATFLADPLVLQGYQQQATIVALHRYIIAGLPANVRDDQANSGQSPALLNYYAHLRANADVQTYI
ncbi:MAG: SurA N-terminal domain-containing protein [Ktedonobacterales bacterium]